MHNAAGLEFDDDKDEEGTKEGIIGLKEVAGPDLVGMVPQEGGPGLGGCPWTASQTDVLEDGSRANRNAEFEEFAGDTFSAPANVVEEHLLDESDNGSGGRWSMSVVVGFGLACPDKAKQVSMLAQQDVGLNDEEGCFPRAKLVGQEDEDHPVAPGEGGALRLATEDDHLLAQ